MGGVGVDYLGAWWGDLLWMANLNCNVHGTLSGIITSLGWFAIWILFNERLDLLPSESYLMIDYHINIEN